MKIRILHNSIRLRLSQTEVKQLNESGIVRCAIQFSPTAKLFYTIKGGNEDRLCATYQEDEIIVHIPDNQAQAWANSDQISMSAEASIDAQTKLKILVEKDFKCGSTRDGEDQSDLFPNPNEQDSLC